jgi:hypothetical protein
MAKRRKQPIPEIEPYGLWRFAEQFRIAAKATMQLQKSSVSSAIYHNLGIAIELGLKAFLRTKGITTAELKREYGHDLEKLFEDAIDRGLIAQIGEITDADVEDVVPLLGRYYREREFEYLVTGVKELPRIDLVESFCDRLLDGTRQRCLSRSLGRVRAKK